ncbi:MAG: DUF4214 domain-containing protein [Rhodoferax sp.]|nr:DUF4214 domain-containing protein [Rhodoferax sp.]
MIEEMREKHRKRIIHGAFKIKFSRLPNDSEFKYWSNLLKNNISLSEILYGMADRKSSEIFEENILNTSKNILSNTDSISIDNSYHALINELAYLPDAEFIEEIYQKLLGRVADFDGKNHLLNSLMENVSRETLIIDMDLSDEAAIYKTKIDRQNKYLEYFFGSTTGGIVLSAHASRIVNQLTNAFQKNQGLNNAHCH